MRRRIVRVSVAVTALAILLFGVPLAIAAVLLVRSTLVNELERTALAASGQVNPSLGEGDALELPAPPQGGELGVYDPAGDLVAGTGPASADDVTTAALGGATRDVERGGQVLVAVPIRDAEQVVGALRVTSAPRVSWLRIAQVLGAMIAGAALAIAVAWAVASRASRRLTAPLEEIARVSARHADGDLAARAPTSGIPETDEVAEAVNSAAVTVSEVLARERSFSAEASHQLRTPLTRVRWGLEAALAEGDLRPAVEEAVREVAALDEGVTALLELARPMSAREHTDLSAMVEDLAHSHRGPLAAASRPLSLDVPAGRWVAAIAPGAARHIVQVLLENADRHGAGRVTVRLRDAAGTDATSSTIALDVLDEGTFAAPWPNAAASTGPGIGLPLAVRLADDAGGRLVLASRDPTTVTLLVPRPGDVQVR